MGWHGDVCNLWSSAVAVQCQSSYTVFALAQMQSPRITPNDFDKVIGKSRVAVRSCKMAFSGPVPNDEVIDSVVQVLFPTPLVSIQKKRNLI